MLEMFIWLDTTSQSKRRGRLLAVESKSVRRGGEDFGRIATGWLRTLGGLFEANRGSRVLAAGSRTCGDCGEHV
jgi:hypothetical protein